MLWCQGTVAVGRLPTCSLWCTTPAMRAYMPPKQKQKWCAGLDKGSPPWLMLQLMDLVRYQLPPTLSLWAGCPALGQPSPHTRPMDPRLSTSNSPGRTWASPSHEDCSQLWDRHDVHTENWCLLSSVGTSLIGDCSRTELFTKGVLRSDLPFSSLMCWRADFVVFWESFLSLTLWGFQNVAQTCLCLSPHTLPERGFLAYG